MASYTHASYSPTGMMMVTIMTTMITMTVMGMLFMVERMVLMMMVGMMMGMMMMVGMMGERVVAILMVVIEEWLCVVMACSESCLGCLQRITRDAGKSE